MTEKEQELNIEDEDFYDKLRELMIQKAIEKFEDVDDEKKAEEKLDALVERYSENLIILKPDAILRTIASQEFGIQYQKKIENITFDEVEHRTIASLEIPERGFILDARIKGTKVRTVNTKKGEMKVADLILSDGTANTKLSLWGKDAESVDDGEINKGDIIRIHGAKTKEAWKGYYPVELQMTKQGRIEFNPDDPQLSEPEPKLVSEFEDGQSGVNFTGKVINKSEVKQTSGGKDYMSLKMSDKEGRTTFLKIWDESLVGIANGPRVREGDVISFTDLRISEFNGYLNPNTTFLSELKFADDEDPEEFPEPTSSGFTGGNYEKKTLFRAEEGDRIEFAGEIVRLYGRKIYYDSCPNEDCKKGVKIQERGGETVYFCEKCNQVLDESPIPVARITGLISDGSATILFTALGESAEKIIGFDAERIKREFDALYEGSEETDDWGKTKDAGNTFVETFADQMKEGFVKIQGVVNIDKGYRGRVELMINTVEPTDYKEEADFLKQEILDSVKT